MIQAIVVLKDVKKTTSKAHQQYRALNSFSDPEAIHGESMRGLATLKDRYAEIDIQLIVGDVGATLIYSTDESEVVEAIHDWFAAQTSDHGSHAEHGT